MEQLRKRDLRAVLEFLEKIDGAADLDSFAKVLVSDLDEVIRADFRAYNEVNPYLKRAFFVSEPDLQAELLGATTILEQHMHDNPLVVYTERTRDGSAHKWSDFVTERQLRTTALWNGLFRPFDIKRQMVALLPAPGPLLVGVVLHRCGSDFSERDRALLNLLRPHLASAYRNAQMRTGVSAIQDAAGKPSDAIVIVGALGEPLERTPRAAELMAAFGHGGEHLLKWCTETRRRAPLPAEPLIGTQGSRTVEACFLNPSVVALRVIRERPDTTSLHALGLTRREGEVVALVADGWTNKEIATRLDVLPATVKKHLEHIYEKLGVGTRTAAAAAAAAFRATDM